MDAPRHINAESHSSGKWCLGHGVEGQAESLRHGHYVREELVRDVFSPHNGDASRTKGFSPTLQSRCRPCLSIKRWHDHAAAAARRAAKFRQQHAERWVTAGRRATVEDALCEMDIGGITEAAIVHMILSAIGQPCPGLCCNEVDGKLVPIVIHTVDELCVDVRDPHEPFSIENIGILCTSCNQAKGDTPWPRWIYRRRAAIRAWQDAIDNAHFRRASQLRLDGL